MRIILAALLTAAIATPVAAHTSKMAETAPAKISAHHPMVAHTVQTKNVSVDGNYVGADPDWRIREELRREYIGDSGGH